MDKWYVLAWYKDPYKKEQQLSGTYYEVIAGPGDREELQDIAREYAENYGNITFERSIGSWAEPVSGTILKLAKLLKMLESTYRMITHIRANHEGDVDNDLQQSLSTVQIKLRDAMREIDAYTVPSGR